MESIKDPLTAGAIGAAIEVHRLPGPGPFETVQDECRAWELEHRRLTLNRQVLVPVVYTDAWLEASYRIDLLVEGKLVVEVKAVERILPVHDPQIPTYMKMSRSPVGLLLNFNTPVLKDGIRRLVNRCGAEEGRATGRRT